MVSISAGSDTFVFGCGTCQAWVRANRSRRGSHSGGRPTRRGVRWQTAALAYHGEVSILACSVGAHLRHAWCDTSSGAERRAERIPRRPRRADSSELSRSLCRAARQRAPLRRPSVSIVGRACTFCRTPQVAFLTSTIQFLRLQTHGAAEFIPHA